VTSEKLLAALQLADSSLPIGRFAHSHGLEELLSRNPSLDEAGLVELIETLTTHAVGPLDGVAVASAHRLTRLGSTAPLLTLDRQVTARKLAPGSREASQACGRRLAAVGRLLTPSEPFPELASLVGEGRTAGNLPVVAGCLAACLGLSCEVAVTSELRSAVTGYLSAAVRLGRISSLRAQVALRQLTPVIADAVRAALIIPPEGMRSVAPELEICLLAHERASPRMFAT
jgi:urease accessory protein